MPCTFKFWFACALLACVLPSNSAFAQSFEELEARLADHPSLVALTYQAEASRERRSAATALPDPVISVGINNFPIFDPSFSEFLPTNKAISIRQEFPNLAGREARAGEEGAMAEQTDRIRTARHAALRGELIALLHDKRRIERQRDLARLRNENYDRLTDVAETEIAAGRPAVFRLAEIEAERTGVARELVDLDREEAEINARLIDLVGLVPATPAPPVAPVDWSGDAMAFQAVRVADAGVLVADYSVEGAQAAWRSNWGAQLTYQQRESGANFAGDDWVSGMVTFTMPLWAERSQAPQLRAAKADRASAEMRYQAAARSAAARYASEAAAWHSAEDNIAVLERNIAAVENEIAAQLTIYESGVGDYAPIIDGELAILKLRSDVAVEEARRASAIARMNALLVTP
ncbi:MAG: transporter [Hyphomonadaceae bacterium TMED5]|nr:transporter [Ponticaulis sp.]OUX97019.1 MAG: transporter [Hyphomonadaceae bacterium TMED5]|tara:strand:+ start:23571 stop:24788 length:1218 start_codon:yes stop_codon:yes gene_type:complete